MTDIPIGSTVVFTRGRWRGLPGTVIGVYPFCRFWRRARVTVISHFDNAWTRIVRVRLSDMEVTEWPRTDQGIVTVID